MNRGRLGRDEVLSLAVFRRTLEARGYDVEFQLYPPGTSFAEHCPCADRADAVLAGLLRLVVGGEVVELGPGEWAEIPGGCRLSAEVVGDGPVLGLDGIRWRPVST